MPRSERRVGYVVNVPGSRAVQAREQTGELRVDRITIEAELRQAIVVRRIVGSRALLLGGVRILVLWRDLETQIRVDLLDGALGARDEIRVVEDGARHLRGAFGHRERMHVGLPSGL